MSDSIKTYTKRWNGLEAAFYTGDNFNDVGQWADFHGHRAILQLRNGGHLLLIDDVVIGLDCYVFFNDKNEVEFHPKAAFERLYVETAHERVTLRKS